MKVTATKGMKQVNVLADQKKYSGLCLTCRHAPICTYPRSPERPVIQCEEFEGYPPRPGKRAIPLIEPNAEKKYAGKYKGLCSNCENRETCTYPKPKGGVWRCEEYQ